MAYEYSGTGSRLDFPNPFHAENWFLALASGIPLIGSLALLIHSRDSLGSGRGLASWLPLLLGIGLLLLGLRYGRRLLLQLRFFFGRNEPVGLAAQLASDQTGRSDASDWLKKILRQNALEYPEPHGPLNGLLYAWIRDLIFAPQAVQNTAQRQFQTAIAILVTLISFVVAWIGFSDSKAAAWMGLFYFLFSVFLLVRPLDTEARAQVSMRGLVVLILVAIFAPVILPMIASDLPDITWLSLTGQTLFLLLVSLAAVAMYFFALLAQMNKPPQTNMARETGTLSLNAHPKQLLDELDRNLQDSWTDRIPNRRYARILPEIRGKFGPFSAEVVEETQPMPTERTRVGLLATYSLPRFRWIAWLDTLGVLMVLLGVIWLAAFGTSTSLGGGGYGDLSKLTLGLAMLTLCNYCLKVGHVLWARIDFKSRLIWVEMEGNFQTAEVSLGNDFTSQMRSSKQVINIETMTLRVWVAELQTVIFGKHGVRSIIGLNGVPDYAQQIVAHLSEFGNNQSVIIAPTSAADLQKGSVLGALNKIASQPAEASHPLLEAARTVSANSAPGAAYCSQCGKPLIKDSRFCGNCGAAAT